MKINRNDPCPCGSGKKYKKCCLVKEVKRGNFRTKAVLAVIGLVVVLGGVAILKEFWQTDPNSALPALPGRVWSEEHGHWHTASPGGSGSATRPVLPPGPAPPGKVWSAEHGHWHDAAPAPREGSGTVPPPGPAPPGKVWSAEHGHWHDAAPASREGSGTTPR